MCAGPDMLRMCYFLTVLHPPGFYDLSDSYSEELPEPRGEGFGGEIPFVIECPNVSHSLYCPVVDLCICSHLLKKKESICDVG